MLTKSHSILFFSGIALIFKAFGPIDRRQFHQNKMFLIGS